MKTTLNHSESGKRDKRKKARLIPVGIILFMMIFLSIASIGKTYGQSVAISETEVNDPEATSILELRSTARGFLAPRMTTAQRLAIALPAQGLLVFDTVTNSFWYFAGSWKEIAPTYLGAANQLFGMNAAGTANEYKTLSPHSDNNITVSHSAGSIFLNTVQNIQTTSSPAFANLTISGDIAAGGTVDGRDVAQDGTYQDNLQALTGVAAGSVDFGSGNFGSVISNNATILSALQELEANLELQSAPGIPFSPSGSISSTNVQDAIEELDANKLSLSGGTMSGDINMGTNNITNVGNITIGGTVDGRDVAQDGTYQDNLQALTGVTAGNTNLGTFSGSTISNNVTIKTALQELEDKVESHPALSFAEEYLTSPVSLSSPITNFEVLSVTLGEGTWMITSETTITYYDFGGIDKTWNATVFLGTAPISPTSVYTSGQSSVFSPALSGSAVTISLSKIITLSSPTTVSIFAASDVGATVVNTPPSNPSTLGGTATAIHAVKIR